MKVLMSPLASTRSCVSNSLQRRTTWQSSGKVGLLPGSKGSAWCHVFPPETMMKPLVKKMISLPLVNILSISLDMQKNFTARRWYRKNGVLHPTYDAVVDYMNTCPKGPIFRKIHGKGLLNHFKSNTLPMTVTELACQLIDAVSFLHDKMYICHGDLNPNNVMIAEAGTDAPHIQIIDFGAASRAAPCYLVELRDCLVCSKCTDICLRSDSDSKKLNFREFHESKHHGGMLTTATFKQCTMKDCSARFSTSVSKQELMHHYKLCHNMDLTMSQKR
eukprot:PhF_6_TR22642/c0_g2_i1/m.32268